MKQTEFRVGNWANNGDKDYIISHNTLIDLIEHDRLFPNNELWGGVPISEKWLLGFGFYTKNSKIGWYKKKDFRFTCRLESGVFVIYLIKDLRHITITQMKYVHRLQNFYFEMKNEELIYDSKSN